MLQVCSYYKKRLSKKLVKEWFQYLMLQVCSYYKFMAAYDTEENGFNT